MLIMAAGIRYSRWAVYAALVGSGTLLNFLAMPFLRWDYASPTSPWRMRHDWGLPIEIAYTFSVLAGVPMALVSLLLGVIAVRELRRCPRLQEIGLARFAVIVGWWVIVIEFFISLLFAGMRRWIVN
jgi:hypothetical protein